MHYLYFAALSVFCFVIGIYVGSQLFKPSGIVGTLKVIKSDNPESDGNPYIFLALEEGGLKTLYETNNGTVTVRVNVKDGY